MSKAKHIYVIYVDAKPERVWDALITTDATRQYWGHDNVSDWKPGSRWQHVRTGDGSNKVDLVGKILESDRPHKLVMTWSFPQDENNPAQISRVTFDIQPYRETRSKLTVTHDDLEPGSQMESGIQHGWPLVLSNLKSYLETGKVMPVLK
ncbi:MAG TPA: SRPBCC family protein [Nevskiaceae bacterium]|nr:SRPBCC family protein [Nevskiaceae bacterium]